MKLGILSDTHGHLPVQVHSLFAEVDAILHAGDIGNDNILLELQTIAPVIAVRGNMDRSGATASYQDFLVTSFDGVPFLLVHDLGFPPTVIKKRIQEMIRKYAPQVVVFGHTHKPYLRYLGNILYFNPGSAMSGRAGKPESVGILEIHHSQVEAAIIPLAT